jgi:hypothetical protein
MKHKITYTALLLLTIGATNSLLSLAMNINVNNQLKNADDSIDIMATGHAMGDLNLITLNESLSPEEVKSINGTIKCIQYIRITNQKRGEIQRFWAWTKQFPHQDCVFLEIDMNITINEEGAMIGDEKIPWNESKAN